MANPEWTDPIDWEDPSDCEHCDGLGRCWNNADPTCGQWLPCEVCGDERALP